MHKLEVHKRHEARKAKAIWDNEDRQSVIQDMNDILQELKRTNAMVEVQGNWLRERDETISKLRAS